MHFPHRNLKTLRRLAVPRNHEILPSFRFAHIHFPSAFVHTYPTCWMVQILLRQKSLWCDAKQSLITRSLGGCTTVLQCKKSASGTSAAASYFEAAPSKCLQSMVRRELQHFLGNPIFTSMHCSTRSLRFNPLDPSSWRKNPKKSFHFHSLYHETSFRKWTFLGKQGGTPTWFTPPVITGMNVVGSKDAFFVDCLVDSLRNLNDRCYCYIYVYYIHTHAWST